MDAHCIASRLWQGSVPAPGYGPLREGFDVVVFCAEEYQPPPELYPGVKVILAPNDDNGLRPPTRRELQIARKASKLVAAHIMSGDKVLVTCMAGRNRSGLVTALALVRLYGVSGGDAMRIVRMRRLAATGEVLSNPHFAAILERVSLGKAA
jgi:hypothetical protein